MGNNQENNLGLEDEESILSHRFSDILDIVNEIETQKRQHPTFSISKIDRTAEISSQNNALSKNLKESFSKTSKNSSSQQNKNWDKIIVALPKPQLNEILPSTSVEFRDNIPSAFSKNINSTAGSGFFNPFGYGRKMRNFSNKPHQQEQKSIFSTEIYSNNPQNRNSDQSLTEWKDFKKCLEEKNFGRQLKNYTRRKLPQSKIWIPPEDSGKKKLPGGMEIAIPLYPAFQIPAIFIELRSKSQAINDKEISRQSLNFSQFKTLKNRFEKFDNTIEEMAEKLKMFTYFSLTNEDLNTDDPIAMRCGFHTFPKENPKEKTRLCEIDLSEIFKRDDRLRKNTTVTLSNDYSYARATVLDIGYKNITVSIFEDDDTENFLREKDLDVYANVNTFVYGNQLRAIDLFVQNNFDHLFSPNPVFLETHKQFLVRQKFEISMQDLSGTRLNEEQIEVVHTIVKGEHGKWPYVLFGPPGTGKTTTLIEAVRFLVDEKYFLNNQILICAPSNAAADKITRDILKRNFLEKAKILRLMSRSRDVRHYYTDEIQDVMCIARNDLGIECFGIPCNFTLETQYKIIICTLASSSYLYCAGLPRGHFSHIFIDEAGQATEVESWLVLGALCGNDTKVVLSGDPKQLGPVVMSRAMKDFGADNSMLLRLSEMMGYKNDSRLMKMLTKNYRSHEMIIEIPSKLFYGNNLLAALPLHIRNELCGWDLLPNKSVPIIFHNVNGMEIKKDPSYANIDERDAVALYVQKLRHQKSLDDSDIGIISPYNGQTELLREHAFLKDCPELAIGSVEIFQGTERKVIIVTTSRTTDTGFLDCDRRFNTAITRAMCLLIVVGNERNLRKIACWKEFIDFCYSIGAYFQDESIS